MKLTRRDLRRMINEQLRRTLLFEGGNARVIADELLIRWNKRPDIFKDKDHDLYLKLAKVMQMQKDLADPRLASPEDKGDQSMADVIASVLQAEDINDQAEKAEMSIQRMNSAEEIISLVDAALLKDK